MKNETLFRINSYLYSRKNDKKDEKRATNLKKIRLHKCYLVTPL